MAEDILTEQDDAISSSGMEPDHPAVMATAHGVISPEMVQAMLPCHTHISF
jgi:hypothetical protein